ncbi:zona pellucida sperm-binding protein 3 isoform X2 [Oryzias latipes]|uniref:zona pellucida sperm-binding protein 3 isoform X2 n=1 Tax=Oryzias latipes TaxID=8090 RepID=UPI0009DAC703|nr:zona pellucida sperm-binding protein 3 isoform X2 [Oryzias latipes]
MSTILKYPKMRKFVAVLLFFCCASQEHTLENPENEELKIQCEENKMRITVQREFFRKTNTPFSPELIRLGWNSTCGPERPGTDTEVMVLSAGLQDCGTESRVDGDWLLYSNQLLLFPAILPTATGSVIVRGVTTVIPVECYYERKQKVIGEPLMPTWIPMTSSIRGFGLLRFSLRIMAGEFILFSPDFKTTTTTTMSHLSVFLCSSCTDECASARSSSVFQQGEAVFLEAAVDSALHPPLTLYVDHCAATVQPDPLSELRYSFITKHGCLMDSVLPGSSSRFLPRQRDDRLCFSVQAFRFRKTPVDQMFISCHLKAAPKRSHHSHLDKACFFHRATFSWRATDGNGAVCECCDSDCLSLEGEENRGDSTSLQIGGRFEADRTVGPLHTLERSHWTGRLSVNQ